MKGFIKRLLREGLDKDGNVVYDIIPDVVYHGQPPKYDNKGNRSEPIVFDKFDQSKKRFLMDNHVGFYFTPDEREARDYAEGGNVYVCSLDIKNPYYLDSHGIHVNGKGLIKSGNFFTKEDMDKLISNGYDGLVIVTGIGRCGEIIAFHSDQIKIIEVIK